MRSHTPVEPPLEPEHSSELAPSDYVEPSDATVVRPLPTTGFGARVRRYRHRYRGSRLMVTALVILLLVPAGVLALRSLWVSLDAAEELNQLQAKQSAQERKERSVHGAFADTEAVKFPEGEAGIVAPEPAQVGEWAPDQVAGVTGAIRQLLITARLDERVQGGDTNPYIEQLSLSARTFIADRAGSENGLSYLTRLAPNYTLQAPPRVKGSMRVEAGPEGQLIVITDYVWVYALEGEVATTPTAEGEETPGSHLAVLHSVERYEWFPEKGYLPDDRGIRPADGELYAFNVDCEFANQGLLALPRRPVTKKVPAISKVLDPRTAPSDLPSSC